MIRDGAAGRIITLPQRAHPGGLAAIRTTMKKTFPLQIEGRHPDRVLDALKHELRKYLKRERRRDLPAGVDYWDFDCRFGLSQDSAESVHLSQLVGKVDEAAKSGATQVYVEILAKHGVRGTRKAAPQDGHSA
jgi:Family of unknown function (DUF6172)